MISLSVVIPAYNEERTIRQVLTAVSAQRIPGVSIEVVVVNDCSKDRTAEVIRECAGLYHQFVDLPRNGGKGAAVIAGLRAATGDYVLVQDADLEYNPNEYPGLLKPVLDFGAEVVMGSRFIAPPWTRVNYFWHKVGNLTITLLFNQDTGWGMVIFATELVYKFAQARQTTKDENNELYMALISGDPTVPTHRRTNNCMRATGSMVCGGKLNTLSEKELRRFEP